MKDTQLIHIESRMLSLCMSWRAVCLFCVAVVSDQAHARFYALQKAQNASRLGVHQAATLLGQTCMHLAASSYPLDGAIEQ